MSRRQSRAASRSSPRRAVVTGPARWRSLPAVARWPQQARRRPRLAGAAGGLGVCGRCPMPFRELGRDRAGAAVGTGAGRDAGSGVAAASSRAAASARAAPAPASRRVAAPRAPPRRRRSPRRWRAHVRLRPLPPPLLAAAQRLRRPRRVLLGRPRHGQVPRPWTRRRLVAPPSPAGGRRRARSVPLPLLPLGGRTGGALGLLRGLALGAGVARVVRGGRRGVAPERDSGSGAARRVGVAQSARDRVTQRRSPELGSEARLRVQPIAAAAVRPRPPRSTRLRLHEAAP